MDTLGVFLKEIKRFTVPNETEQRELLVRAKNGDMSAREELIVRNIPLGIAWARKFLGRGWELEDLIQEAGIGIVIAADRFDMSRTGPEGNPIGFSTYAVWWIRQRLCEATIRRRGLIRVPAHWWYSRDKLGGEARRLLEQIAGTGVLSLNYQYDTTKKRSSSLDAFVADDSTDVDVVRNAIANERFFELRSKLLRLNKRDRDILWMRAHGARLKSLAQKYGVTRERIRQLEHRALLRLAGEYGVFQLGGYSVDGNTLKVMA